MKYFVPDSALQPRQNLFRCSQGRGGKRQNFMKLDFVQRVRFLWNNNAFYLFSSLIFTLLSRPTRRLVSFPLGVSVGSPSSSILCHLQLAPFVWRPELFTLHHIPYITSIYLPFYISLSIYSALLSLIVYSFLSVPAFILTGRPSTYPSLSHPFSLSRPVYLSIYSHLSPSLFPPNTYTLFPRTRPLMMRMELGSGSKQEKLEYDPRLHGE